jgi:chromosome segregation ATPase
MTKTAIKAELRASKALLKQIYKERKNLDNEIFNIEKKINVVDQQSFGLEQKIESLTRSLNK